MYKNLKISRKLALSFSFIIILSAFMVYVAASSISSVSKLLDNMFKGPYIASTESMGLRRDLNAVGNSMRSAIIEEDSSKYSQTMDGADEMIAQRLTKIKESFKGNAEHIANLEVALSELNNHRRDLVKNIEGGEFDTAVHILQSEYLPAFSKANDLAIEINTEADEMAESFHVSSNKQVSLNLLALVALFLINTVMAICLSVITTKAIVRPLADIKNMARQISIGNLKQTSDYHSKDEIGEVAQSLSDTVASLDEIIQDIQYVLGAMAEGDFNVRTRVESRYIGDFAPVLGSMRKINIGLSSTLVKIGQSADSVSIGSNQVSQGAQVLSQGSTQQATSIEELADSINEISESIGETADTIQLTRELVNATGELVEHCNTQMGDMTAAMLEISTKSVEVNKIIKVIDDIAFQTNILALNAAVEAARAGVAGKGFAVVADEVRNLASKSAEAAKDTTKLIEGTILAVDNGRKLTDDTAESLLEVVEGAKEVVVRVDKVAEAATAQASSAKQISVGIEQISAVVQTNSATAQQSAAASEELSGQAQIMRDLVGHFKLRKSER